MESSRTDYAFDKPAIYRIRVRGSLDEGWSSRLGGMQIVKEESNNKLVTILYGYLADQSALSGVLNSVYDLGMSILSVECLEEE
jgi:hypothetical protein